MEKVNALVPAPARRGDHLTPRQIVAELDKYIIGQAEAKRSVAIALRNAGGGSRSPKSCGMKIAPQKTSS